MCGLKLDWTIMGQSKLGFLKITNPFPSTFNAQQLFPAASLANSQHNTTQQDNKTLQANKRVQHITPVKP